MVAVALLVVWSVVIRVLPAEMDTAQTLWGGNLISAQDYLYREIGPNDVVIVGSSLSENLLLDEVAGRPVLNLGLAGQGVFDGLHLVEAAAGNPGVIFVEMNVVMQEENDQFSNVVLNPAGNVARLHLPALRQRYQPVGVAKGLLFGRTISANSEKTELKDRPINEMALELKRKDYTNPVPAEELLPVLEKLRRQVELLQDRDIRFIFFETPVDPSLCTAPKAVSIREGFREVFPRDSFAYLDQAPCAEYLTTDGHHLGARSQARYSAWLAKEMERLLADD